MLGILFGLSMDYEVFLLSRIREEWDRTGDNTAAVARRPAAQRPHHHQRGAAARGRDRRLRHLGDRLPQDDRHRHARRGAARRDPGPRHAGARDDAPARQRELVGARRRCGAGGSGTECARASRSSRAGIGRAPRSDGLGGARQTSAMAARCTPSFDAPPAIAVIGGSGFYEFLDDPDWITVETPFGKPSSAGGGRARCRASSSRSFRGTAAATSSRRTGSTIGRTSGRCARSGVRRILAPCAVGSLQPELGPGRLVVPDQLVDRTTGRVADVHGRRGASTSRSPTRTARHCAPRLLASADQARRRRHAWWSSRARGSRLAPSRSGTHAQGWSIVNMTGACPRRSWPASSRCATRPSRWSPTATPASRAARPSPTPRCSSEFGRNIDATAGRARRRPVRPRRRAGPAATAHMRSTA